jgi:hypothetical protein
LTFGFSSPFDSLHDQLDALLGSPLEDAHPAPDPDSCDIEQATSTGLAYFRCDSGVSAFVAQPEGLYHWAWLGDRMVAWIGPSLDPPDLAQDVPVCLDPAELPDRVCPLRLNVTVAGFLSAGHDTDAYSFVVTEPESDLVADMMDLPADYDLYLADAGGAVLAQSVNEGTDAEHITHMLPAGIYYLYVHVDPGREPDPSTPYKLRLAPTAETPLLELTAE